LKDTCEISFQQDSPMALKNYILTKQQNCKTVKYKHIQIHWFH